ncbi:MAG: hypothetical protein ACRC0Y_04845 [Fusobacteriaceae bacterium]
MKKLLLVLSILAVQSTMYANDEVFKNLENDEGQQTIQDQNQDLFLKNIQEELENTKKDLAKLKTDAERDAAKLKAIKPKWNHEVYVGIEQEVWSDDNFKYGETTDPLLTSPYTGMYLYQDGSKMMYDMQYLKTYFSRTPEYNRNRFSVGARYMDSFKLESGKTGTWAVRLGYRNDNYHWKSATAGVSGPNYSGYVRKGEERNEIWLRPMFTFNASPSVRLNAAFQFRAIDRSLDYHRFGSDYSVKKRDWSSIQEHIIGGRYTFANRNFVTLEYLFTREDLKRTLLNVEHTAMLRYFHVLPNKDTLSPYARIPLGKANQKYYDGLKNVTREAKSERGRIGIQYRHIFNPSNNVMFDVYYRPENRYASNGTKTNLNLVLWTLELTHKF